MMECPESWAQGRTIFGGLVAAGALRAMREYTDRRPRSLLISFVGPVSPGLSEIEVTKLRSGRSMTQLEARVSQDGVRTVVIGAFGEQDCQGRSCDDGYKDGCIAQRNIGEKFICQR